MFKAAAVVLGALLSGAAAHADEPLRDPMRPFGGAATPGAASAAAAAARPRFALTAVLVSSARRVAIVNGKAYFEGDRVDGAELVAIEIDAVRLRENGVERVVSLNRPAAGGRRSVQGETVP